MTQNANDVRRYAMQLDLTAEVGVLILTFQEGH